MKVVRAITWVIRLVMLCVLIPVCHALMLVLPRGEQNGDE